MPSRCPNCLNCLPRLHRLLLVGVAIFLGCGSLAAQLVVNVPAGGDVAGASLQVFGAGGGTINLAAGNYYITGSIVLGSNTTLNGAGGPGSATQSVIYAPASPNGIAMVTTAVAGEQNIAISNLVLDGNIPQSAMLYGTGNGNYAYNNTGIYVYSQSNTSVGMNVTNVEVRHTLRGILTGLVDNLTISGCYFHDNNPGGFSHNMYLVATDGVEIDHTRSDNALTGDGLHIDFGGNFYTIRKSEFSGNNGIGILSQQDNYVTVEDSKLNSNTSDGIQIDAGGLLLTRDEMNYNAGYGFNIPDTADGNGQVNGVYTVADNGTDYFYQASINDFTLSNPGANVYAAVQATGVTGVVDTADWTLAYPGYTYMGAVDFNANHLTNGFITFPYVGATMEGTAGSGVGSYVLTFRYSNGTTQAQTMNLTVNGGAAVPVTFAPTGSYSTWGTVNATVVLNVGNSSVTLAVPAGATSAPELDTMTVNTPTPNVPGAPTNLKAVAAGPYQVNLSWTAPAASNNNAAQTYDVYKNNSTPIVASNITGTTWSDTRIFYGETTSQYFVTAVNQGGQSAASNTVMVTTGIDAPPGLQISSGNTGISLNWLGVSGGVSFHVKRALVSGGPYQTVATVAFNGSATQSTTDTTGVGGTTYYYVVSAVDVNGVESANSYEVSATAQGFSITTAGAVTVPVGQSATTTVYVAATGGFNSPVSYQVTGLPTGVTATLAATTGNATLTLTAASTATPTTAAVQIVGTSGVLTSTTSLPLTVMGSQTITFAQLGTQLVGVPLTLTATASSGLPILYATVTPSVCTVSGSTATFVAAGTCGMVAFQQGNAVYAAATPIGQDFAVVNANHLAFMVPNSYTFSSPLQLSATSNSPEAVTYSVVSGPATLAGSTLTLTGGGTVQLQASQPGDASYAAATVMVTFQSIAGSVWVASATSPVSVLGLNGVALTNGVLSITGAGTIIPSQAIAFDAAGSLWVANANGVSKLTSKGGVVNPTPFTSGGISVPLALAVDGLGQVWIANSSGSISALDNTGAALGSAQGGAPQPMAKAGASPAGIAVDASGNVWVVSGAANSITEVIGAAAPVSPAATALSAGTVGTRP